MLDPASPGFKSLWRFYLDRGLGVYGRKPALKLLVCAETFSKEEDLLLEKILKALQWPEGSWLQVVLPKEAQGCHPPYQLIMGLAHGYRISPSFSSLGWQADGKTLVTYHPGEMLANPSLKKDVWRHVLMLKSKNPLSHFFLY